MPKPDPLLAELTSDCRLLHNPTRMRIIALLARGPMNVGAIVAAMALGRPTTERHLSLLRVAGFVAAEAQGRAGPLPAQPRGVRHGARVHRADAGIEEALIGRRRGSPHATPVLLSASGVSRMTSLASSSMSSAIWTSC